MTHAVAEPWIPTDSSPGTARRVRKVGVIGMGDVTRNRIWPAIGAARDALEQVLVCSLEERSFLNGIPHAYLRVEPGKWLPMDDLADRGLLEGGCLWIVASPSGSHVPYARQLAGVCRVAVEKPIASCARQAGLLRPFLGTGFEIHPMDHKLFNPEPLAWIDACRKDPSLASPVRRIEGTFYEAGGFARGRCQEDGVADIQWHLLTVLFATFASAGLPFAVRADGCHVSSYTPDPEGRFDDARVWTASRLEGRVVRDGVEIGYAFRQAKAAPRDEKCLCFYDGGGTLLRRVALGETGWRAHARMLRALMEPVVDMRHTLADALAVMDLVDRSRSLAVVHSPYRFGGLPDFLDSGATGWKVRRVGR